MAPLFGYEVSDGQCLAWTKPNHRGSPLFGGTLDSTLNGSKNGCSGTICRVVPWFGRNGCSGTICSGTICRVAPWFDRNSCAVGPFTDWLPCLIGAGPCLWLLGLTEIAAVGPFTDWLPCLIGAVPCLKPKCGLNWLIRGLALCRFLPFSVANSGQIGMGVGQ